MAGETRARGAQQLEAELEKLGRLSDAVDRAQNRVFQKPPVPGNLDVRAAKRLAVALDDQEAFERDGEGRKAMMAARKLQSQHAADEAEAARVGKMLSGFRKLEADSRADRAHEAMQQAEQKKFEQRELDRNALSNADFARKYRQ